MFETLSDRLSGVMERLTRQGALSEEDVRTALREVRVALLEADVSLPVARDFVGAVQGKATGQAVTRSVTPGQQVVKIVHDEMVSMLAGAPGEREPRALRIDSPPAPVLMVGLQGSGKTTTTAKLALRLKEREGKRVLMASLDTNRPAAMEQLAILGTQVGVDTLPIVPGETPVQIARRAKTQASLGGYDVYLLDTAGAAPHRRGADPAGRRGPRRGPAARDAARRGRPHRPGRGQRRARVRRAHRRLGRGADADGRRRARGCCALDARRHRQADPLRRRGRAHGRARALPPRARRGPHPRHGRHRLPRRARAGDDRAGAGRAHDAPVPEGPVQHERPSHADRADAEDGRHGGRDGHDARHGQDGRPGAGGRARRHAPEAPARADRFDDQEGAGQPGDPPGQPQEAHREAARGWRCPS